MFSTKSYWLLVAAIILVTLSYLLMAFDPTPGGMGLMTLWVAPPLLLMGLFLPIPAILGLENLRPGEIGKRLLQQHNLMGWVSFLVSFGTYYGTLEPTASLWDCSEFIASAYKLEVPHTPGTPLSLLFGRLFSLFATDVKSVAWTINLMSAFFSALAVMLVYHLIHYFGDKVIASSHPHRALVLMFASVGGSLCLAFSDTFWFSAVEAETYGIACFFLLLVIWLILRGLEKDEPIRSRVFILIGYLSGLAYCIHPMCLLVLPVLPFAWLSNGRSVTTRFTLVTILSGLALVFAINRFLAIGIADLAFFSDLLAVNVIGLPFYSGVVLMLFCIMACFYFLLRKWKSYRMYSLFVIFLLAGFSPYLLLFIRSQQNPPIDETNPEDLYQIKAYMNRESYGSSPLVFGPYYDARIENVVPQGKAYYKDKDRYRVAGTRVDYEFESSRTTILPRIYSRDENHVQAYRQWLGLREHERPTFADNIRFMFSYQLGHMYVRYLLWNFVGRESDVQDASWLKPWEPLSEGRSQRSRNQYWMIPLLLGMVGAWSQFLRDKKGLITNAVFFLITGAVLALYLNSPPIEPRERDYIYVASYIAFCIWIGLGFLELHRYTSRTRTQLALVVIIGMSVPAWMLYQNFDDHDRSGRTLQVDHARAVLGNCAPNAILFTGGDNDTFPLWYLQEVEGYRTDVRVMVLSYFNTDWYINQLRRPSYQSAPLEFFLTEKDYRQYGMNDVLYLENKIKQGIDVNQYLALLKAEHPALRVVGSDGDGYHILPSRLLKVRAKDAPEKELLFEVTGTYLEKNALAILDLLISNVNRPLYFNVTSMNSLSMDISPYLVQEGLVYRLTSDRSENGPSVNTTLAYKNLIEALDLKNLADEQVNFNYEDFFARIVVPLRQSFNALANACHEEGNSELAGRVLVKSLERLHYPHLPPSYTDLATAEMLRDLGKDELARSLAASMFEYYYAEVRNRMTRSIRPEELDVYLLRQSTALLTNMGDTDYFEKFDSLGL